MQVAYTEFAKHHCNVFTSRKELNQGEGVCVGGKRSGIQAANFFVVTMLEFSCALL